MKVTCPKCGGPAVPVFVDKKTGAKVTCAKEVGK